MSRTVIASTLLKILQLFWGLSTADSKVDTHWDTPSSYFYTHKGNQMSSCLLEVLASWTENTRLNCPVLGASKTRSFLYEKEVNSVWNASSTSIVNEGLCLYIKLDLLHALGPWLQIIHKHVQRRVNPDSKFFRALALNYSHLIHNHQLLGMAEHWLHVLVQKLFMEE